MRPVWLAYDCLLRKQLASGVDFSVLIGEGTQTKINTFVTFIKQYAKQLHTMDAYDLAYQVAVGSGIINDLKQEKTPESISKFENLEELLNSIKEFTTQNDVEEGALTLEHYLENVALLTDADAEKPEDNDKVTIMTIHSSKGLEFGIVFIVGMEEDLFPSKMSLTAPENIEEERRLFYVAITRAKEKAILSFVGTRFKWGTPTSCTPSRFLSEIDEQYLDLPQESSNFAPGFEMNESESGWNRKPKFAKETEPSVQITPAFKPRNMVKLSQAEANTAPPVKFEADDPSKITVGMLVLHERFGMGEIMAVDGQFPNIKATVHFKLNGEKQLLLKFAKLKIM